MEDTCELYFYHAQLIRVIDGDTIVAMVDLGFDTHSKKTIRLYGIDAWESRTRDLNEKKKGILATEFLQKTLDQTSGKFILESKGVGKFGRCLGVIYVNEQNVNELLIKEHHATPYNV